MRVFEKFPISSIQLAVCLFFILVPLALPARGSSGSFAVVNTSSAIMREYPDYESAAVSQTRMGTLAKVLERKGYWVKVETPEPYVGWVNALCLAFRDSTAAVHWTETPRFICTAEYEHVHVAPDSKAERLSDFVMGNVIEKLKAPTVSGWAGVSLPDGRRGWVKAESVADFDVWCDTVRLSPERLAAIARLFRGAPYMWGGTAPGHFDCSGLVGFCYYMCGVLLPRDASQQVFCGEEVSSSEMKAGDLVFFGETRIAHVALCTAPGRIIHSSQLVRENSLNPSDSAYYRRRILHIRRIAGHVGDGTGAVRISSSRAYFK